MLEFLDKMDRLERRLERAFRPKASPGSSSAHTLTEASLGQLPLAEFVPAITPRWDRPDHLGPLLNVFERIKRGESVRALVSVPPQHGKTETELHGLAQLLVRRPQDTHAFAGYSAQFAYSKSRTARDYAREAGVKLREDSKAVHEWRTRDGGGLFATGVGGPLTGHGITGVLLVDDPFKNRQEAESQLIRDNVHNWFTSTAMTRIHPSSSVVVVHTRWHADDLIGRLQAERDANGRPIWEYVNLPAISDAGEALWPKHRPLSFLEAARARNEYDWWSMYMGQPRPRGGAVFRDVHFYEQPPTQYRVGIGLDLAYTSKTHADWSVAVVLAAWMAERPKADGKREAVCAYSVLDVRREQTEAPKFASTLRQLQITYPGATIFSYVGGTEKGVVDFLKTQGVAVHAEPAKQDKFVRAQPVAAAWNDGRVLVNRSAGWTGAFVSELASFTGVSDRHDDQVDALAGAFAALNVPTAYRSFGSVTAV